MSLSSNNLNAGKLEQPAQNRRNSIASKLSSFKIPREKSQDDVISEESNEGSMSGTSQVISELKIESPREKDDKSLRIPPSDRMEEEGNRSFTD